jgi:hypothetical protein
MALELSAVCGAHRHRLAMEHYQRFVSCVLQGVQRMTPHWLVECNLLPHGVTPERQHPAFFGCYDWHSAVHSHWLLVRLLPRLEDARSIASVVATLDGHLTAPNMVAEARALPSLQQYEMPYGFAWLLELSRQLRALSKLVTHSATPPWWAANVSAWCRAVDPFAEEVAALLSKWCLRRTPLHPVPNRKGLHENSAFSLTLLTKYARAREDHKLASACVAAAHAWYGTDRDVTEPPVGSSFLSPLLAEVTAILQVGRVAPSDTADTLAWLARLASAEDDTDPQNVAAAWCAKLQCVATPERGDPRDPYESHLIGLNFSRAW